MSRLFKEVKKGLNQSFDGHDICEAAYRFYKTKCKENSLQAEGKFESKNIFRRCYEQITRKCKEREAVVMKNSRLTEEQKFEWLSMIYIVHRRNRHSPKGKGMRESLGDVKLVQRHGE